MIKDKQQALLHELPKTPHGQALKEFLDEKLLEIRDVMGSESWEETLGRKFAVTLIQDLFAFMELEKSKPRPKTQYH